MRRISPRLPVVLTNRTTSACLPQPGTGWALLAPGRTHAQSRVAVCGSISVPVYAVRTDVELVTCPHKTCRVLEFQRMRECIGKAKEKLQECSRVHEIFYS